MNCGQSDNTNWHLRCLLVCLFSAGVLLTMGCRSTPTHTDLEEALSRLQQQREQARLCYQQAMSVQDLERKRELYARAVQLDEQYGPAHHNLGVTLFKQHDFYRAARHLKRAADLLGDSPVPLTNLAILHAELNQWERALDFAQQARDRSASDPQTLRVLARAMLETSAGGKDLQAVLNQIALRDPSERWREWAVAEAKAEIDRRPVWEQ